MTGQDEGISAPGGRPQVSVAIPAYNATRWIGRTITSVLRQRFEDFELIVVDDGSSDDLGSTLAPFLHDGRLRLVRQDNRGLAGARNRGIAEARAELVAPLDADDLWHPDFLAETVAALDRAPEAPFAFTYSFRVDAADRLLFPIRVPSKPFRHDLAGLICYNSVGSGSAGLYRRSLMQAAGGYDETLGARGLPGAEDWKLALRLARMGDPMLVERPLVGYRLLMDSMSQKTPQRQLDAVLAVLADIRAEMPEIAGRHFADGRTGMSAWLLPAFARQRQFRNVLTEIWRAYIRNPLWFRNDALRRSHVTRAQATWAYLARRVAPSRRPLPPLHTLPFEGDYPFAFLAPEPGEKH